MPRLFKKTKKPGTNFNHMPNVQDAINSLTIPPPSQASHLPQQPIHVDPTIAQDQMQVNVVTTKPSSSALPDMMDTAMSTTHDQMQVDVIGAEPSSSNHIDSTALNTSTAPEQMQEDIGQVLPRRRRGWISSTVSIGQDQAYNQVCDFLKEDEVGIVGIYGMGGVGKTTLMKRIRNKFLEPSTFKVIWVVVSQSINVDSIQKVILEEMNLRFDQDECPYQRAKKINKALDRMEVAFLFDDIWEYLDLEELGIVGPIDLKTSTCKIIFTTRSEKVCNQMEPHREIKVKGLEWDDAWALFYRSVGKKTLEFDHKIQYLAKKVAKECKGLPLALTVIGRTMTCKYTCGEWEHALDILQKSPSEILDVEKKLFAQLRLSYASLPHCGEKKCFLYCCLFSEDAPLLKDLLVKIWIGEGLLALNGSYVETFNRGKDIIGTLLTTGLLERLEGYDDAFVRMHDVIREMGLWIASSELKMNFYAHTSYKLTQAQIADRWKTAHGIYVLDCVKMPEQPLCLNLSTLIFENSKKTRMLNEFFKSMCKIRTLQLIHVIFLDLPTAIGQMLELRHLLIIDTNLKTLPMEIGNLSKLKVLDLRENFYLNELPESIGQLVELRSLTATPSLTAFPVELGNLTRLEDLDLGFFYNFTDEYIFVDHGEFTNGHVDFKNALMPLSHSLRHLRMRVWPISHWNELSWALEDMDKLSQIVIRDVQLGEFSVLTSSCLCSLESLELYSCTKLEKFQVAQGGLQNLWKLMIFDCESLECIFGLQHLQNLVELNISNAKMEELIKSNKGHICFPNLKALHFERLDELKIICGDAVLFPSLTELDLTYCLKLEKLPRGLMNENRTLRNGVIWGSKEWWDGLSWQDNDFKFFIETSLEITL